MALAGFQGPIRLEVNKFLQHCYQIWQNFVCFSLILPFSAAQQHNILENCLKLISFILTAKLMMGQETIDNENEEVFSSRPTGALLPPKELWFTSPELIEMFSIQGRLGQIFHHPIMPKV